MAAMQNPPDYVVSAIDAYRGAARQHARRTVAVALAAAEWAEELAVGAGSRAQARRVVRQYLVDALGNSGLASRYLAIAQLADLAEAEDLRLDGIKSQGVLLAILPVIARADKNGAAIPLQELLSDAASMTIDEFRAKWRYAASRRINKPSQCGFSAVCDWIVATAAPEELLEIRALICMRLEDLAAVADASTAEVTSH